MVPTIVGIRFLRLFRTYVGMCIGILVSGMGAVHLPCRLARSKRPYVAGDVVGKVMVNLQGYCVKTARRMWVALCMSSSSSSGIGVVFVSAVMAIDSSPAGEVGYPAVSIIYLKLVADEGVEVVVGVIVVR